MNTIAVNVNSEAGMKKQKNGNANLPNREECNADFEIL